MDCHIIMDYAVTVYNCVTLGLHTNIKPHVFIIQPIHHV